MTSKITQFTANLLAATPEQMDLIKSSFDWQANPENSKEIIIMVNEDGGDQSLADILNEAVDNVPCGLFLCHAEATLEDSTSEPSIDSITGRLDSSVIDSVIAECDFGERTFVNNGGADYEDNELIADVAMYFEPVDEDGNHDEEANSEASYLYIAFDKEESRWTVTNELIENINEVENSLNELLLKAA